MRDYIFTALVAKTEQLDLISLEKELITERKAIDYLIDKMEQYANFGFHHISEKLKESPNYFFQKTGFLDMILDLTKNKDTEISEAIEDL